MDEPIIVSIEIDDEIVVNYEGVVDIHYDGRTLSYTIIVGDRVQETRYTLKGHTLEIRQIG